MSVSFGLVVPAGPQKGHINQWQADLDTVVPLLDGHFESLWMTDHFFWADKPTYEAWTVVTYLATQYPQFKIAPIVLGQSYRNPALLAKMAATLQSLTQGRFIMGIGAGWKEDEYHAYGYPYPRPSIRVAQLEDTLEIMTRLWKESGKVSYAGQHYSIKEAYCEPKPNPMIPILVGGGGTKTMMLAARFADMWNMPDTPLTRYRERANILKQHCETIGRDPDGIQLSWFGRMAVHNTTAEAEALSNGKRTKANAIVGSVQEVIDQLNEFVDFGVSYFMVEILGLPQPDIARLVFEDILPNFQSRR
ncbi:MAG: LLM class flavin-dependent oxidoreductase [Anaerolineae bacterium]|nr:LLM class flavin-dependent oxidoreductase [Anaerolineae bacterium]